MSPSVSARDADGIPCTTSSLIDAHKRRRIPAIALERRLGAAVAHQPLGQPIEIRGRHARRHRRLELRRAPRPRTGWPRASVRSPPPIGRRSRPPSHDRRHRGRQIGRDGVRRLVAVHRPERRPHAVELDERLRVARVHPQALAHDVHVVVAPLHERAAAPRARRHARRRDPAARCRKSAAASAARPASPPAPRCSPRRAARPSSSIVVERLGLRHRARKPVEHEPAPRIRPRQPLAHDADHRCRRRRAGPRPSPPWLARPSSVPGLHGLAQDVAGRDRAARRAPARTAPPACPCPAPGGPTSRVAQARRRATYAAASRGIRVFFMKPS